VGALTYGGFGFEMAPPGHVPVRFYHYVRDPTATSQFTSQYIVPLDQLAERRVLAIEKPRIAMADEELRAG